eukprot:TRINITY_DN9433_c0_g1_i1.p1 TRINITY_DN9433_c0_g1~~TRINITY_DN9433_c0_g1_i1.p1  ORF type:complete len:144 (+),score=23.49 TRINITY_DN9433_c0_g1_i1:302-733(+)
MDAIQALLPSHQQQPSTKHHRFSQTPLAPSTPSIESLNAAHPLFCKTVWDTETVWRLFGSLEQAGGPIDELRRVVVQEHTIQIPERRHPPPAHQLGRWECSSAMGTASTEAGAPTSRPYTVGPIGTKKRRKFKKNNEHRSCSL